MRLAVFVLGASVAVWPIGAAALDCRLAEEIERFRRTGIPVAAGEAMPRQTSRRLELLRRLAADPDRRRADELAVAISRATAPRGSAGPIRSSERRMAARADIARILETTGCFREAVAHVRPPLPSVAGTREATSHGTRESGSGRKDSRGASRALHGGPSSYDIAAGVGAIAICLLAAALLFLSMRRSGAVARRSHARLPCDRPVTLDIAGDQHGTRPARAVDVSREGMKVATHAEPRPGTRLRIGILGRSLRARVIWSNRYFAGLRIEKPLDDAALSELRTDSGNEKRGAPPGRRADNPSAG